MNFCKRHGSYRANEKPPCPMCIAEASIPDLVGVATFQERIELILAEIASHIDQDRFEFDEECQQALARVNAAVARQEKRR